MAKRSFLREFMTLSTSLADDFQDQVKLLPIDDSNLRLFEVEISPKKGVYAHAVFRFLMRIQTNLPRHLDNVCLNITDCWNRSFGLKSFLQALLFLFYEPKL
ncbi:hypothetical protein AHF37_08372 [Paragonimus kellicotti]|nr:hypothetical protein AHF37_08372 [Paragonimus kellicotti]